LVFRGWTDRVPGCLQTRELSVPSEQPVDAVIIGGGHNGLVCAAYLAGAGRAVTVVEARSVVGGAAVTEEFHPGFRNSSCSYTVSLLNPRVIADLRLAEHGLRIVERPFANFLPLADGRAFRFGGELTPGEVARFSRRDAERLPEWFAMLERVVTVLRVLSTMTPPNVSDRFVFADWLASWSVARQLRGLDMRGRRDLLELFTKSAGELLDDWFESDPLKAVLGWDSIVGNFASPYAPGTAYVLLAPRVRRGQRQGRRVGARASAAWGRSARQSRRRPARAAWRSTPMRAVARVLVRGGRAVGVALADGRELMARRVVAAVNPKAPVYADVRQG
jgi:phytoene dehydrogenase-like protein